MRVVQFIFVCGFVLTCIAKKSEQNLRSVFQAGLAMSQTNDADLLAIWADHDAWIASSDKANIPDLTSTATQTLIGGIQDDSTGKATTTFGDVVVATSPLGGGNKVNKPIRTTYKTKKGYRFIRFVKSNRYKKDPGLGGAANAKTWDHTTGKGYVYFRKSNEASAAGQTAGKDELTKVVGTKWTYDGPKHGNVVATADGEDKTLVDSPGVLSLHATGGELYLTAEFIVCYYSPTDKKIDWCKKFTMPALSHNV